MDYINLLENLLNDISIKIDYARTNYTNQKMDSIIEFETTILGNEYPKFDKILLRNGLFFNEVKLWYFTGLERNCYEMSDWIKVPNEESNKIFSRAVEIIGRREYENKYKVEIEKQDRLNKCIENYMKACLL